MSSFYFPLVGIVLYFVADALLLQIERRLGRPLEQRTVVFFALLLGLALIAFAVIRKLTGVE